MSSIRSVLDEMKAQDLRFAGDEELEDDLLELERSANVLLAERLRRLAEIERRRTYLRDGFLSGSVWLARRAGVAPSEAKQHVRMARVMEQMPVAQRALSDGELSGSAMRVLVEAREESPEEFAGAEDALVEAARTLSVKELRAVVAHWRQAAAPERAAEREEWMHVIRRLYVSPTLNGMVRVDGDLDPETGQTFMTALQAVVDADVRGESDMRTSAQRRADALGEIARQWLDSSDRPEVAGERPHVTVNLDLAALEARSGRAELETTGPITAETARRIACDASVTRVLTRGRSEVLDVGRKTSVVPSAVRRALVVRDEHCAFPGCDRPQSWCDAHHVVHWADGGETNRDNLLLLCRPHHRMLHTGFGVEMARGRATFRRPDGSPIAPPVATTPRGFR
jgi:Domain of unknown function (DUF222)/HNH endonuclease